MEIVFIALSATKPNAGIEMILDNLIVFLFDYNVIQVTAIISLNS